MKQNNDIPDKIMERIRKLMRLKESTTSEGRGTCGGRSRKQASERIQPVPVRHKWKSSGNGLCNREVRSIQLQGHFRQLLEARPVERAVPVQLLPDTSLPGHNRHVYRRNR